MTRNSRHRVIAAAAFLAAAPALAGCGAGSDAITNQPYSPTEALSIHTPKGIRHLPGLLPRARTPARRSPAGAATPLYLSAGEHQPGPRRSSSASGSTPHLGTAKVSAPVDAPRPGSG